MLPMKRKRYPKVDLTARYRCPECERVGKYAVAVRPTSETDRTAQLFGRPTEDFCLCGARTEYEGLRRRP